MKKNGCSFSNFRRNDFVLYFSTEKWMKKNEKKKIIPYEWWLFLETLGNALVTIHADMLQNKNSIHDEPHTIWIQL